VTGALLLLLPLAVPKPLADALGSDESQLRTRAAYAIARTWDPEIASDQELVIKLLDRGTESAVRLAVIRGLFSRDWPEGMPDRVDARAIELLTDADPANRAAAIDGIRLLPRERALSLLRAEEPLAERRPEGANGAGVSRGIHRRIVSTLYELGDADSKDVIRRLLHRHADSLLWLERCTLEDCGDDLTLGAWLGEDLTRLTSRYADDATVPPSWKDKLVLARLRAVTGDEAAISTLVDAAVTASDSVTRENALAWLIHLPPAIQPAIAPALRHGTVDPDPRIRLVTATILAANVHRVHDLEAGGALAAVLADKDPDVRIEGACGLFDLRAGGSWARTLEAAEASETDPTVKAVLQAAQRH
jgi:hypothetical protein